MNASPFRWYEYLSQKKLTLQRLLLPQVLRLQAVP